MWPIGVFGSLAALTVIALSAGEFAVDPAIIKQLSDLLVTRLPLFVQSGGLISTLSRHLTCIGDLEVQERAVFAVELLKLVTQSVENG